MARWSAAAAPGTIGTPATPEASTPDHSRTMSEPNHTPQTTRPHGVHGESVTTSSVSGRTAAIRIVLRLIVGAIIAIAGIFHRQSARQALAAETNALAAPNVLLSKAKSASPT